MLNKKVLLFLSLLLVGNQANAKLSDSAAFLTVAGGAALAGYGIYKLIDHLSYETPESFQKKSSHLLQNVEKNYSEQIKKVRLFKSGKVTLEAALESLAEDVIATDTVDNYLKDLHGYIDAVSKRTKWRPRKNDTSPYLVINGYMDKLTKVQDDLNILDQFLRPNYLRLYLLEKQTYYKYVVELQSKKVVQTVMIRKGYYTYSNYPLFNYVSGLKKDCDALAKGLGSLDAGYHKIVERVRLLLNNLSFIRTTISQDKRYVLEKEAYYRERRRQAQKEMDKATSQAFINGYYVGQTLD